MNSAKNDRVGPLPDPARHQGGSADAFVEWSRMPMQLYAARCAERRTLLDAAVTRVVAACRAEPTVLEAFVFGSYATGAIGPTSDLDVLVIRDTDLGIVDRVADLAFAARGSVRIDMIVVTPEERATTFAASSFGATILTTAKRIYAA